MNMFRNGLFTVVLLTAVCLDFIIPSVKGDVYRNSTNYAFEQIRPINLTTPPQPQTRFGPGPEGWVKLRFTINADGTIANIDTIDFMPRTLDINGTVAAVAGWTFQSAVVEGAAVEWHNNLVTINFDLAEIPNLSGPLFTTPYSEVQALIAEGRLDRAGRLANTNLDEATYSLHDIGLGNVQLATVEMQRKDMHLAHQAIVRATPQEVNQLSGKELDVALQYRFTIELALGRFSDAIDTFERRDALPGITDSTVMKSQADQLYQVFKQGYNLSVKGKILDRDAGWFYIPSRRTFTITDVDGQLKSIAAVCNRNLSELEFQPDVEWTLPDSWGECSLSVMGNEGTTFNFIEFP